VKEKAATSDGWCSLAKLGIDAKQVSEFIVTAAKAGCAAERPEATHRAIPALDPPMVLFNSVI
jgi:hypothetical protein